MSGSVTLAKVGALATRRARRFQPVDMDDAEDLAQEALIAAWREIEKGNAHWPYLKAVIDNRIRSCLRHGTSLGSERGKHVARPKPVPTDDVAIFDGATRDAYPSDLDWLPDLTPRDMRFVERFMEGDNPSQIAREMGLSPGYGPQLWARIKNELADAWLDTEEAA